jgi:hypothetical protein
MKCIRTKRSVHRSVVGDIGHVNERRKTLLCEIQLLYLDLTAEACLLYLGLQTYCCSFLRLNSLVNTTISEFCAT